MAQPISQSTNVTTLGAFYTHNVGGQIIDSTNENNISNWNLTAGAIIHKESLAGITFVSILIIDIPTTYENIDSSSTEILASSVIVVSVQRNSSSSSLMNISLYFQVLSDYRPSVDEIYSCSFYDLNQSRWNESGCTVPEFNIPLNRYECSCNHLSTFALVWLPNIPFTPNLETQDIASLVFESVSIVCFIIIIIHATIMRPHDSLMHLRAYDLFPLLSSASATILFIFHIALETTVYTRTSSLNQTQCFLSSSVLLFFVYFLLMFMLCTKTSVGYFNYLRFVHLLSEPPLHELWTMLIISFFISITWVAFAAGFNSHSSFNITQLYPYRLCWFTRGMIYYFLTIPVCLFILTNIILSILVAIHIINHVRNATSLDQLYERMKRCVIVLFSSCLTHGIGWLFGPFLTVTNPTANEVLGWLFVILNGLEGVWAIILYIIIRSQNKNEQKYVEAARKWKKSNTTTSHKNKKRSTNHDENENRIKYRSAQNKSSQFLDVHDFILCY